MRVIQLVFNTGESYLGRSGKTGNFIMFFFYLFTGLGTQLVIYMMVREPTRDSEVRDAMGIAAVWCVYFELF